MKYFNDKALPHDDNDTIVNGGVDTTDPQKALPFEVNPLNGGMLNQPIGKLVNQNYDYISATYPNATTEVYAYKVGGSGGVTVATVTVVYTAAAKEFITSVAVV